jgi:hypothetical protein
MPGRFKFAKRRQQFVSVHNETLSVAVMCVNNPDRSPARSRGPSRSPNSNQLC